MRKSLSEEKRVHILYIPRNKILWYFNVVRFLSRRISMLCTNFSKVAVGNDFVNKSAKLSFEQICFTVIFPFSSKSCIEKLRWDMLCSIIFNITSFYLSYICRVVFSYNVAGRSLLEDKPHDSWMCWVIDLNLIHS